MCVCDCVCSVCVVCVCVCVYTYIDGWLILQEKLQSEFEEMKYSGEAKMSSGQLILEDMENRLQETKNK